MQLVQWYILAGYQNSRSHEKKSFMEQISSEVRDSILHIHFIHSENQCSIIK